MNRSKEESGTVDIRGDIIKACGQGMTQKAKKRRITLMTAQLMVWGFV